MSSNAPTTILKRDVLGRVTVGTSQREALLNEFERSGLKGVPFARMVGVPYQTFATWIQKRRRARGDYSAALAGKPLPAPLAGPLAGPLVAPLPAPTRPQATPPLRLVEAVIASGCVIAAPTATASQNASLEVVLPSGARLLVATAQQVALAAQLILALRSPC